jgi:hypothetical protein
MWLIGIIILLVVGSAVTASIGWAPRATSGEPLWDIAKFGGAASGYAGTFAGFSLAATTFIAGLDTARTSPLFATTFGMMLIAFLVLLVATFSGGGLAAERLNQEDTEGTTTRSLAFVVTNMCTNLGVSITWLALVPLVEAIGMPALAEVFAWWLPLLALAAGIWVALVAYHLTLASVRGCLAVAVLGLALPAGYRLAARPWPALWPTSEPALKLAFVALGAAFLLFGLQMGLLVAQGNKGIQARLRRTDHRLVLAASQAFVAVVVLLWFAVAFP